MLRGMTAYQFEEWAAFYKMENEPVEQRQQTGDEMYAIFSAFANQHNAAEAARNG